MLKLDISTLVFVHIAVSVVVIIIIWLLSGYRRGGRPNGTAKDMSSLWKCSVCFNIYVDSKNDEISTCPMCGSYNKKVEGPASSKI